MNSDFDMALVKRTRISIWHIFMGLWHDYVDTCIKMYNFKGSEKYDRLYVIDYNFPKDYWSGPSLYL